MNEEEIKYLDYEGLQDFKQRLDLLIEGEVNIINLSINNLNNIKANIDDISPEVMIEDANGHEYVEIAGIKWATCNVGADNPDDNGLYFAWGETTGYTADLVGIDKNFSWTDYELAEGNSSTITKYNDLDNKIVLELEDDAAQVNMGGTWRMPTTEEWQAFGEAVNTEWTDNYNDTGVAGLICTDKIDNSKVLFFPATGVIFNGTLYYEGSVVNAYSSTRRTLSIAYHIHYRNSPGQYVNWVGTTDCSRVEGRVVRGVLDTMQQKILGTTITDAERDYWNNKANSTDITLSNWNQSDNTKSDYIKNKPDLTLKANQSDLELLIDNISTESEDAHYCVDFGLPSGTLWATTNIGSTSPEEVGLYFLWGDTEGYNSDLIGDLEDLKYFSWDDYKWSNDSTGQSFSKYTSSGLKELEAEDDAATVLWGSDWNMPTAQQVTELLNNTDKIWINDYKNTGIGGLLIYEKGKDYTNSLTLSIFFPESKRALNGSLTSGNFSDVWLSSLGVLSDSGALRLTGHSASPYAVLHNYDGYRYWGCNIRPVTKTPLRTKVLGTTITDSERTNWNNKSDFSGSYSDLTNKPIIPDAQIQADWEQDDNSKADYIKNKPDINLKADLSDLEQLINNISITQDNTNGHDYVDLGLPSGTLWATMNVGAISETEYGNYYQYGKGAAQYAATSGDSDYSGTENPLDSSVDTAVQVWGGSWHMPTIAQMQELTANTTYQWVTDYNGSGINGGLFTAQNGNSVFFPAAGFWTYGSPQNVGNYGHYWGSSPYGANARNLGFSNGDEGVGNSERKYGFSVRPVLDSSPIKILGETVLSTEKAAWNAKSDFSGSYNDLTNKPDLSLKANVSDLENVQLDIEEVLLDIEEIQLTIEDNERVVSIALNDLSANKQDTLVSGTNIKTVNGSSIVGSGDIAIKSYHTLNNSWLTDSTTLTFCNTIAADSSAEAGMTYSGKIECSDLPANMVQGEVVVLIISDDESNGKNIHLVLTSVNTAPYRWEYSYVKVNGVYVASGWIGYLPQITNTNKLDYSLLSNTPNISEKANQSDLEALEQIVEDNEEVIATALNDLEERKAELSDLETLELTVEDNERLIAIALNDLEERKADLSDLTSFAEKSSISLVNITTNTSSSCNITGNNNSGKDLLIIYRNTGSSNLVVTVPTTYITPNGSPIELLCKVGGYCEVNYINIDGNIFARGL